MKHTLRLLSLTAMSKQRFIALDTLDAALRSTGLPARTFYWLSRIRSTLANELAAFDTARVKLIKEHGKQQENGDYRVEDPAALEAINSELQSLDHDIELPLDREHTLALPDSVDGAVWAPVMELLPDLFTPPA